MKLKLISISILFLFSCLIFNGCNTPIEPERLNESDNKILVNEYILLSTGGDPGYTYRILPDGSDFKRISSYGFAVWINDKMSYAVQSYTNIYILNSLTDKLEKTIELTLYGGGINYSPVLNMFIYNWGKELAFVDFLGESFYYPVEGLYKGVTSYVDKWVYYLDTNVGRKGIYRLDIGETLETIVLSTSYSYGAFSVSYDGNYLVSVSSSNGNRYLSIINTNTKTVFHINMTDKVKSIKGEPVFSKGGEFIYFFDDEKSLYVIDKSGNNFQRILKSNISFNRIKTW